MNRELGADFDEDSFRHLAFYNGREHCVELHAESLKDQVVTIDDEQFAFREGETIRTERSHKYDIDELAARASDCGLTLDEAYTDDQEYFSVLAFSVT